MVYLAVWVAANGLWWAPIVVLAMVVGFWGMLDGKS